MPTISHELDRLTREALATASVLLDAAARQDRLTMRRALRKLNVQTGEGPDIIDIVEEACCEFTGPTAELVFSNSRDRLTTDARHVACYVAFRTGMTHSYIGRQINRDHTTVMNAVSRVRTDMELLAAADRVEARLTAAASVTMADLQAVG